MNLWEVDFLNTLQLTNARRHEPSSGIAAERPGSANDATMRVMMLKRKFKIRLK